MNLEVGPSAVPPSDETPGWADAASAVSAETQPENPARSVRTPGPQKREMTSAVALSRCVLEQLVTWQYTTNTHPINHE